MIRLLLTILLFPIITTQNVMQLQSHVLLDFDRVENPGSGVFVMNDDASIVVSFAAGADGRPLSTAVVWDGLTGDILNTFPLASNSYDRSLTDAHLLVAEFDGVTAYDLTTGEAETALTVEAGPVVEVWQSQENGVCAETMPPMGSTQGFVMCSEWDAPQPLFTEEMGAVSRIGRVPPPLAVLSDETGKVELWHMERNEIIAAAQVNDVAVFGTINAEATHLAWRDPASTALYLLDFVSGENQQIAELDGAFISYLHLSQNADIIFGVDPMSARSEVIIWNVVTGEASSLGTYRACEKQQPDYAQLSDDGTALVIGCDTGIDIWRIDDE
jgi:hypothetical protein